MGDQSDAELPLSFSSVWGQEPAPTGPRTTRKLTALDLPPPRTAVWKRVAAGALAVAVIGIGGWAAFGPADANSTAQLVSRSQQLKLQASAAAKAPGFKHLKSAPLAAAGAGAAGGTARPTGPATVGSKSVPLPTALGPTGARVDVEGEVVACEPGRMIIRYEKRYYLIRGEDLKSPVGSRYRARGMLTGVGRGGVVFVDSQA